MPGGITIIVGPGVGDQNLQNNNTEIKMMILQLVIHLFVISNRGGTTRSQNFEVIENYPVSFKDASGFETIKTELNQCVDFLTNW